jgi:methenyltetrahydrofolate cyclohydrolase
MQGIPGSSCSRVLPRTPLTGKGSGSLWQLGTEELLEQIAAPEPAPGAGSVAIVAACLGTALLLKSVAISLRKKPQGSAELASVMRELLRLEPVLHDAADRDVAAFDRYLRARRLTHDNVIEARVREKAIEEALVQATCVPTSAAAAIRSIVTIALEHLAKLDDVVLPDVFTGLTMLNSGAACLLMTAEDNRRRIAHSAFCERLARQAEQLRAAMQEAESDLTRRLRARTWAQS